MCYELRALPTGGIATPYRPPSAWLTPATSRHASRPTATGVAGCPPASPALHDWLQQQDLADAQVDIRVQQLLERLHQDKLIVAFVAEFSRGKSELINAIFFADFGQRLLPSSAGRTTMCPTELLVRRARARRRSGCCRSRRGSKDATVAEFKNYADEWVTFPLDLRAAEKMGEALVARVAGQARAGRPGAQVRALRRRRGRHPGRARARRRRHRRHPVLAPRGHQFPAPAAAAGPRDPRHAGLERDRHRTRTDAQPAAQCARACCSSWPPTPA